jgi:hypothetical protein
MDAQEPESERTDHVELLELEHEGWQALCTGGEAGAEHYGAVMTDSAVMVLADGSVRDRGAVVASLRESPSWDTYTIDDPAVVSVADDVLALVYHATGRRGDTEFSGVMTSLYVRSPEGWRLALHQQTAPVNG